MSKARRDALIRHIRSIACIGDIDIVTLLSMIPLSKIQTFLQQQILELNDNDIRKACFNILSINDTLPPDIVRHVLSFNTFPHNSAINATNKQWNKCSAQIKAMQNREREQVVDNYPIKYNEAVNNVWIVDPNRTQLTSDEIDANRKGPCSNIQTSIERCQSGDKLLIHDGVYEVPQITIGKSIQIVGVGDNVIFRNMVGEDVDNTLRFINNSISYIENISFAVDSTVVDSDVDVSYLNDGHIGIESNAKVTINKCEFKEGIVGINCKDGGC
eukprot:440697_1